MVKVRGYALRPDSDGAVEFLEPDLAPVLAQGPREKFQMAEDAEPFVQVEFDVLLDCGPEETAAPTPTFAVGDRAADRAAGTEEEEIDMGVDLGKLEDSLYQRIRQGVLTCETIVKLTLKCRFNALTGISVRKLPSFHLCPKEYGARVPSRFFLINTTGFKIPGTAAEAKTALQITQSGDVR